MNSRLISVVKNLALLTVLLFALSAFLRGLYADSSAESEVNGMKADNYFRQFIYTQNGQCGSTHELHQFVKSETEKIGLNENGQELDATISIFLDDNGTYRAFYQEVAAFKYSDDGHGYYSGSHQERVMAGDWTIDGSYLTLRGLGHARAVKYNGRPAMEFTPYGNPMSRGFAWKPVLLRQVESISNPILEINPCLNNQ
jgi:hypothetical protein